MLRTTKNKQKGNNFAKQIRSRIEDMIDQHNQNVKKMNRDADKHGKGVKIVMQKGDPKADQEFYMFAADTSQKLKILIAKLGESQKIKKERRDTYTHKIGLIVGCLDQIVQEESVKISFDHNVIKWVQDLGTTSDQVVHSLALLEKQSMGFCFGGSKNTLFQVEKGLFQIIGYLQFWLLLPKCTPQIRRQIQHQYMQLDYNQSIFFDIDKMIINQWPEPEIIEVQVPVERIVEKIVVKEQTVYQPSKDLAQENSFKEEIQRRQLLQKYQKLHREIGAERQLRQAHQMLIGLGRSQNIFKAIETYKSIPEMSQSQAKQSIKSQTQLRINPLICNILGCLYEQGRYLTRDLKKAVEYYIKSASVQDAQGMYKIGKFLEKNLVNSSQLFDQHYSSRKEEVKDAIQHYQKAAQKGHLDALTDLAHIYENGIRANSIRQQNSVVSNSQVQDHQDKEFIISPNLDIAVKYYQLAKKEQFPRALNNLGALYVRMGNKLSQTMKGSNVQRGIKYLKKASEHIYPKAFLNLGKCYQNGLGVKQNIEKAKGMYIEGAELGDNQCKLQLVKCLISNSISNDGKNQTKIAEYLRQIVVSDPSNAQALFLMGILYEKGISVQKSSQNAFHFINRSAKLQYSPAEVKLGDYYYSGYFVDKNIERAKYYYQKAANRGDSQGYINLGLLYSKCPLLDEGKNQQIQKANKCLLEAAKMGNPTAFIFMNKQSEKEKNIVKQAAQLGSRDAVKILAKTNTTALTEAKSLQKGKQQYGVILNKLIKQTGTTKIKEPQQKKLKLTEPPLSQKQRNMMLYSPRARPDLSSPVFSIRYNSPQSYRQSTTSRQFFRKR